MWNDQIVKKNSGSIVLLGHILALKNIYNDDTSRLHSALVLLNYMQKYMTLSSE